VQNSVSELTRRVVENLASNSGHGHLLGACVFRVLRKSQQIFRVLHRATEDTTMDHRRSLKGQFAISKTHLQPNCSTYRDCKFLMEMRENSFVQ